MILDESELWCKDGGRYDALECEVPSRNDS